MTDDRAGSEDLLQVGDRLEVEIEKEVLRGGGIARPKGFVVFVPFCLAGEKVLVQIVEKKKTHARAELIEVIQSSPRRKPANCPVFGLCGGCAWQHLSDSDQVELKQKLLIEHFSIWLKRGVTWHGLKTGTQAWAYRNRIQLHKKDGKIGYHRYRSHEIVDIEACPIAKPEINQQLQQLRKKLGSSDSQPRRLELHAHEARDKGFTQVNSEVNELLIQRVLEQLQDLNPESVLDLYCGNGNFSFPIGKKFPHMQLQACELNPESIKSARERLTGEGNAAKGMQFYLADTYHFLLRVELKGRALVILDPPRSGCESRVLQALRKLPVDHLIYISCDPATLARDLKALEQTPQDPLERNFRTQSLEAFDMFPQTEHVEMMAVLSRDSEAI